jgi:hypothetical protein
MSKRWGYKVNFNEKDTTPILVEWPKSDVISIMEFLADTRFPSEAIEDVNFWRALKHMVRPIFQGQNIVAVRLNLAEEVKKIKL